MMIVHVHAYLQKTLTAKNKPCLIHISLIYLFNVAPNSGYRRSLSLEFITACSGHIYPSNTACTANA